MSDGAHVATAAAAAVAGLVVVVRAEGIAAFLLSARVQARLLNPDRNEQVIESLNNPRARRLEVWIVRGFGAMLIAGAVLALAS